MAYNASFMMMASTSLANGGLGLAVKLFSHSPHTATLTPRQPWQLGIVLALSSVFGVLVAAYGIPVLVRRLGWYGALRITAAAHVALFPLIALAGVIARHEGRIGWGTSTVLVLVLLAYEIGETSYT